MSKLKFHFHFLHIFSVSKLHFNFNVIKNFVFSFFVYEIQSSTWKVFFSFYFWKIFHNFNLFLRDMRVKKLKHFFYSILWIFIMLLEARRILWGVRENVSEWNFVCWSSRLSFHWGKKRWTAKEKSEKFAILWLSMKNLKKEFPLLLMNVNRQQRRQRYLFFSRKIKPWHLTPHSFVNFIGVVIEGKRMIKIFHE